jgi:Protein of unknown function (DUF2874)
MMNLIMWQISWWTVLIRKSGLTGRRNG